MSSSSRISSPTPTSLEPFAIGLVQRQAALDAAHGALFQVQDRPPAEMIVGVAVLFHTLARHCGLAPADHCAKADRIIRDEDFFRRANSSAQSLRDFVSLRVLGRPDTTIS